MNAIGTASPVVPWRPPAPGAGMAAFIAAWLEYQCRLIGGVTQAVVVLGQPPAEAYAPVASWPSGQRIEQRLVAAGELALATVRRGDVLFQVAPLDAYRVVLSVDESQIADVRVGQHARLLTTSLPTEPLDLVVEQVTPVAEARDGRTVFRVEASLERPVAALRPGMEGIAKIEVEQRRVAWIWTRTLMNWLRLHFWAWQP